MSEEKMLWELYFDSKEKLAVAISKLIDIFYSNNAKTLEEGINNLYNYFELDKETKEKQELLFILISIYALNLVK